MIASFQPPQVRAFPRRSLSASRRAKVALALLAFASLLISSLSAAEWTPVLWRGKKRGNRPRKAGSPPSPQSVPAGGITRLGERRNLLYESPAKASRGVDIVAGLARNRTGAPSGHRHAIGNPALPRRVKASGSLLTLTHPHTDPQYPALTRTYEWRGDVLHCRLSWQGGRFYGIHIVQLPRSAVVYRASRRDARAASGLRSRSDLSPTRYTHRRPPCAGSEPCLRQYRHAPACQSHRESSLLPADHLCPNREIPLADGARRTVRFLIVSADMGLHTQVFLGDRINLSSRSSSYLPTQRPGGFHRSLLRPLATN